MVAKFVWFLIILLTFCDNVHLQSLYSISAPGTLRPGFNYNVVITMYQSNDTCKIEVGLTGLNWNDFKTVEIKPNSSKVAQFSIPKNLIDGDFELTAQGISGISFKNQTKLFFDDATFSVFIQTDKATYKPGDKIQFRVLFLDHNLRPYEVDSDIIVPVFNDESLQLYEVLDHQIDIIINDGANNLIKQYKNVKLISGMFFGELQLSEYPILGYWDIDVKVNKKSKKNKFFKVIKYVLPKYEVLVETAKRISVNNPIIHTVIHAKYTYGKPVKGKAIVSIKPTHSRFTNHYEKTITINGKIHVESDISSFFNNDENQIRKIDINVTVEEELTGITQISAPLTIDVVTFKYQIEDFSDLDTYFVPGEGFQYKVVATNLDGSPVQDDKNTIFLQAVPYRTGKPSKKQFIFDSKFDNDGVATFDIRFPRDRTPYYLVKVKYLNVDYDWGKRINRLLRTQVKECTVEILTQNLTLNKDVSIKLSSTLGLDIFFYQIAARGDIILSETVQTKGNPNFAEFIIKPTFAMIPKAVVLVYFVRNNTFYHNEVTLKFPPQFENKIDIEIQSDAKPGEDIKIDIKTDPDSYVGLLGVDQSVLLLKGDNDFNRNDILGELYKYDSLQPESPRAGYDSGVAFMTNANVFPKKRSAINLSGDYPFFKENNLRLRKDFFEVWIWDLLKLQGNNKTFVKKVPDTITSWVITGFSLNSKTGLALTEEATKLRVFQPFFASTNLPYSVKRGEVISIPVIVFNYLEKTLDATVTLDNSDEEFEFTEAKNEVEEKKMDKIQRSKTVTVPGNSGKTVYFLIRPMKVGHITLKITATSPLAGDAIHHILKIEPEGVTEYVNKALVINLNNKEEQSESIDTAIPKEAVPNSEYVEVSVVGDLLGPTIQNLDKLVRMPYGCGEQNMVNFVPNILVLNYLTSIRMLSPTIEEKAKKFLEIGYQQELTYKHDDGSYSAFGKSDKSGSTWLTAYVAKSFHQAAKFTEIDPKVLSEALTFLAGTQSESGKFVEVGKVIDHQHSGESEKEIGLTAFVLLAFLENVEAIPKFQDNINKGLKYISENIDSTDDLYALSISLFALQLAKNDKAPKLLEKLESIAKTEGDLKWWTKVTQKLPNEKSDHLQRRRSVDIEITSYLLQVILENRSPNTTLPIIKWLVSQRNGEGGFVSTQDTVVGLQALNKFAESTGVGQAEMDIEIEDDQGKKDKLSVNNENSLVLQTYVLPTTTQKVDLKAKGKGNCLVQVSYKYNIATKEEKPRFIVKPTVIDSGKPEKLVLEVCSNFVPIETEKESNMAVMEVNLPSGFTADSDSFDGLKNIESVKRVETKKDETVVIVYYDNLGENEICGKIEAIKTHAVAKQKPVAVIVYDYYDNVKRGTEYYSIESSLCDICQGDDCGEGCLK